MKYTYSVCILLLLPFLAGGCALPQNQGRIVRSGEVDQLVESATVLPDHTYYFTGPEAQPDVIMALHNSFTLQSKYWIKVDDVAEKLKGWNRFIDNAIRIRNPYEGAWIMTPEGRQAGIWYSEYDYSVVQFPDPSSIIIYAPLTPSERRRPSLGNFGWDD